MHVSPTPSMREQVRLHRSHRTLLHSHRGTSWLRALLTLFIGVALTYGFLYLAWPALLDWMTPVIDRSAVMGKPVADSLIGISNLVPIPILPSLNLINMLWVAGSCVVIEVCASLLPFRRTPLRYWISANLIVLLLAALYAFFTGRLGYGGAAYMGLVERTSLLMILCAPAFIAFVAALLPFSIVELGTMLLLMVACDTIFAVTRIAAFALLAGHAGAIAEMNLYMFFGPLMDVVYFMTVYSLVLVSLSRRLNQTEAVWQWS